jgi:hypothetical protein
MVKRVVYDPQADVVITDLSELTLTREILDETVQALIEMATSLPHKVFALICWRNTIIPSELSDYYGQSSAKLQTYYLGALRYEANNAYTNVVIRTQIIKTHRTQRHSNIYATKEEALKAVQSLLATEANHHNTAMPSTTATLQDLKAVQSLLAVKANHHDTAPAIIPEAKAKETRNGKVNDPIYYFETPYVTISWDKSICCVVFTWKKYVDGPEYREAMDAGLQLFQMKKCKLLLTDSRKRGVVTQADQDWTINDWLPRLAAAGIKKTAIVMPEKMTTYLSISRITTKNDPNRLGETLYFDTIEEARAWLSK